MGLVFSFIVFCFVSVWDVFVQSVNLPSVPAHLFGNYLHWLIILDYPCLRIFNYPYIN